MTEAWGSFLNIGGSRLAVAERRGQATSVKQQQFDGQIVFASSRLYDDSIIGRLSNIETRNGPRFKLGKYAIHFHMVGNVKVT